jgi:hypothetical protein
MQSKYAWPVALTGGGQGVCGGAAPFGHDPTRTGVERASRTGRPRNRFGGDSFGPVMVRRETTPPVAANQ